MGFGLRCRACYSPLKTRLTDSYYWSNRLMPDPQFLLVKRPVFFLFDAVPAPRLCLLIISSVEVPVAAVRTIRGGLSLPCAGSAGVLGGTPRISRERSIVSSALLGLAESLPWPVRAAKTRYMHFVVLDNFKTGKRLKSKLSTVRVVLRPTKLRELLSSLHAAACSNPHGSHVERMAVPSML